MNMEKVKWEIKKLSYCCEVNPRNTVNLPEYFYYIDLESVVSGKLVKNQFVAQMNAPSRAQRLVLNNDVLYQTVRPYQMNNYIFKGNDNEYVASTGYALLRAKENIDADFIYYVIHTHDFVSIVLGLCTGTSYPAITPSLLNKIDIPIPVTSSGKPSLPTQRRIVEILSSVDKVIDSTETLIEKYKAIKMGLLNDLLQPKEGWQKTTLGKIGKISMCKRIFSYETSSSGDIPFYKIGTFGKKADAFISKQLFEEYKNKFSYPKIGDILISASGTIGRTVVYDGKPAYFQDSNIIWIDNDEKVVLNQFLVYLYKTITWNLEGSTIARLYNDNLNRIEISYPDLAEQRRISSVLQSVDAKIASEQKVLEKYISMKKGLMKDLFTGK